MLGFYCSTENEIENDYNQNQNLTVVLWRLLISLKKGAHIYTDGALDCVTSKLQQLN